MNVKGEDPLQLLNKSKLRNGTKTWSQNFSLFTVKWKLEFSSAQAISKKKILVISLQKKKIVAT